MNDYCEACECDPCDCDGMETVGFKLTSKTYVYIKHNGIYYVPRTPSLCEAREREEIFVEEFGEEPFIIGPFEWEILSSKFGWLTLKVEDV